MIRDTSTQDAILTEPVRRFRRRHMGMVIAALMLLVVASAFIAWRNTVHVVSAARVRIAEVTRGTLVRDTLVNGRVVAANSPTLFASAPSSVQLKVAAGDPVKKGQVLAILDSPDLSNALKREQSSYEQLKAEVARQQILANKQKLLAQRDADIAEIDRLSAQRTLERYDRIGNADIIAKIDWQRARDAMRSAEVRAAHTTQAARLENEDVLLALKTKTSELERQRLALANAQRRVDELTVRAPLDGVVGTLSVQDRGMVALNAPLMTVVDLSRLEVELEVPESFVADMGLGMRAEVQIGGVPVIGVLSALSPEVVRNQVLARVRFDGTQPQGLRQSQRVSARLLIEERPDVLMLPRGPFVEHEGGRFAYVVRDGSALRTPIRIGATSVNAVEIVSGLKAGDRVVIAGTDTFENASRVTLH